ncbi:MAG: hypothetical protein PVI30_02695 [Myxococcales bacterium]|jgi:hypothetical protein
MASERVTRQVTLALLLATLVSVPAGAQDAAVKRKPETATSPPSKSAEIPPQDERKGPPSERRSKPAPPPKAERRTRRPKARESKPAPPREGGARGESVGRGERSRARSPDRDRGTHKRRAPVPENEDQEIIRNLEMLMLMELMRDYELFEEEPDPGTRTKAK